MSGCLIISVNGGEKHMPLFARWSAASVGQKSAIIRRRRDATTAEEKLGTCDLYVAAATTRRPSADETSL